MTLPSTKCLLDSNCLIYGVVENSPFQKQAREFLNEVRAKNQILYISPQTLLEYSSVLISYYKFPREKIVQDLKDISSDQFYSVVYPSETTILEYMNLLDNYLVHPTDLFFAATAISNGIDTIITADSDFGRIKGIKVLNPFK